MNNKSLLALTAVSLLTVSTPVQAQEGQVHVNIDGREQVFADAQPYIKNNRTLVPFRAVLESLGAQVTWDETTSTITAVKEGTVVTLQIGSQVGTVDGVWFPLDAAPEITNNRTMVPLRFLSEVLGADVQWNAGTSTAMIITGMYPPGPRQALNLQLTYEIGTLDPSVAAAEETLDVLAQINEGLVRLDENGRPIPGVAKSWDVSPDGKTYTFHLREDAKWSDGSQVTAADFEYSWKRSLEPYTQASWIFYMDNISGATFYNKGEAVADEVGVRALDDVTLRVDLEQPMPYFPELTTHPIFFPQKESFVRAQGESFGSQPHTLLYNGPFKMTAWTYNEGLTLEKNPHYWDRKQVRLAKVNYLIVQDPQAALNLYETGQFDRIRLAPEHVEPYKNSEELSVLPRLTTGYIDYNQMHPVLQSAKVRQALTYAVDAEGFVNAVYPNTGTSAATGFVPNGVSNGQGGDFRKTNGDLINREQNRAQAKALLHEGLQEVGLSEFPTHLKILVDDAPAGHAAARYLAEQWEQQLGIRIEVDGVPYKTRLQRWAQSDFDLVFMLWGADYNDPMTFLDLFATGAHFNLSMFKNSAYDQLIRQASLEADAKKRMDFLYKAEQLLMEDMPVGPLLYRGTNQLLKPHVKNIIDHSHMPSYDLKHAYLSGKK